MSFRFPTSLRQKIANYRLVSLALGSRVLVHESKKDSFRCRSSSVFASLVLTALFFFFFSFYGSFYKHTGLYFVIFLTSKEMLNL